jgi:hypothetical protein
LLVFFEAISYILTKTMWLWVLLGLAVAIILFYSSSRENMTNDQLISTLKTFGDEGTKTKDPNAKNKAPLWGPSIQPIDPADSLNAVSKTKSGEYPQVFGPAVALSPGTTAKTGPNIQIAGIDPLATPQGLSAGGDIGNGGSSNVVGIQSSAGTTSSQVGPQSSAGTDEQSSAVWGLASNPGLFVSDQTQVGAGFEYNPDLKNAFPYDGPPQPFLTDFSKIQH